MKISFVGLGKLGCCMAVGMASKGFDVIGIDINEEVVNAINRGVAPHFEPELEQLIKDNKDRFTATTDYGEIAKTDITFIMVPTPSTIDGGFSTEYVETATLEVGRRIPNDKEYHNVVITSTVVPGSIEDRIKPVLERASNRKLGKNLGLCHVPEFMAIGTVVHDFLNPEFTIIGESDMKAGQMVQDIYEQLFKGEFTVPYCPPFFHMSLRNAELTKVANNAYVAMKMSFANTIAEICEKMPGGNAREVLKALGADTRIGRKYLNPGLSYGGPCVLSTTDISTVDGPQKAESIRTLQLSENNSITEKMDREYTGNMIGIKVRGYEPVYFSPEHPIYIDNTQRKDWGDMCRTGKRRTDRNFKGFKQASEVKLHDVLMIPKINRRVTPVEYSEDFMEFLGWYLAEGFATVSKDGHYRITLRVKPKKDAERIHTLTKELNSKINHYRDDMYEIRIYDRDLTTLVNKWFGKGAKNKSVPLWIMHAPKSKLKYFLRGYLQGDGSQIKNNLTFSTSSEKLAKQLFWLFNSLGFYPFLNFVKSSMKTYKKWTWQSEMYSINFSPDDTVKLEGYLDIERKSDGGLHRNMVKKTDDAYYVPVTDIKEISYTGKLYNFATETEKYSVPFIVHNCFPRDSHAFIYAANKYGTTAHLAQMTDVVNIHQIERMVTTILRALSDVGTNKLSVLGITYKPDTVLVEESAALKIVQKLVKEGIRVTVYDPSFSEIMKTGGAVPVFTPARDIVEAIKDAEVCFIATPWTEFTEIKKETFLAHMKDKPIIIDAWGIQQNLRNDPEIDYREVGTYNL